LSTNTLLTTQEISYESLMILKNNLTFARNCYKEFEGDFGQAGNKIGATLNIRKPPRFIGRTGQAVNLEGLTDSIVPLTLNTQFGVDFQVSSFDMKLSIDDFRRRYLVPAMIAIANKVDRDGLVMAAATCPNVVGTPGTPATTLTTYLQASQKLDEMGTPFDGDRWAIINPAQNTNLVTSANVLTLFNPTKEISEQYRRGYMGNAIGLEFSRDQNVNYGTVGTFAGVPLVNGANQVGSSLITDGWTSTTLVQGDHFTIAGVFAVNPQSRVSTGSLQQFVVLAPVTDASGAITVNISPSITPSGQFQNVTTSPADNAAISVVGTSGTSYGEAIVHWKQSFAFASVPLEEPGGIDMGFQETDPETGVSLRYIRQYIASTDQWISRFDVLYGYAPLYPETACIIATN
jgi:hypothetical protein